MHSLSECCSLHLREGQALAGPAPGPLRGVFGGRAVQEFAARRRAPRVWTQRGEIALGILLARALSTALHGRARARCGRSACARGVLDSPIQQCLESYSASQANCWPTSPPKDSHARSPRGSAAPGKNERLEMNLGVGEVSRGSERGSRGSGRGSFRSPTLEAGLAARLASTTS